MQNARLNRIIRVAALAGSCAISTRASAIDVANQTDWNNAVAAVAVAGASSTVSINFTGGFTLTSSLATLQAGNANVMVNITGNGQTINGASAFQGIQVSGTNAPTVNISNLAITNTAAIGGAGTAGSAGYLSAGLSYGAGGGGGGGTGAGGGLFVGSGANVTLASVTFTGNSATGGAGGAGGVAQNGASSPTGGNGGAGGAMNNGGATGGGGAGGAGGNTGTPGTAGTAGTAGAGGGGSGGSGTLNSTSYTSTNPGGAGGTGAGNGGLGGGGVTNNNGSQGPGANGGFGGAGGGAQGGAVYVANGGTLTILNTGISAAAVTGGAGGAGGAGQGAGNVNGTAGAAGQAAGSAMFLDGVQANIGVSSGTVTYSNTIAGSGATSTVSGSLATVDTALNKTGAGTLVLSGINTFTGNINISGGTLSVASQAQLGNGGKALVMSDGTTFAITSTSTFSMTLSYAIAGKSTFDVAGGATATLAGYIFDGASAGTLVKTGAGTLILSPNTFVPPQRNTYTGGTLVSAGTLRLDSAAAVPATSPTFINEGATLDLNGFDHVFGPNVPNTVALFGTGTVTGGNVTIGANSIFLPGNGTPGSSMTINGNLAFQSGTTYLVQVNPATASFAAVTGTATLTGATVNANFASGSYIAKQYTILTASGGVTGSFLGVTSTALPSGFNATLSQDANNAYLNLNLGAPIGLNVNQQNVSTALTNFFNTTGGIPAVFGSLTPTGLSQVSGETATGTQQTTFNAMTQFLGAMTDPFIAGRGDPVSAGAGSPTGYADEESLAYAAKRSRNPNDALGAIYTKAPPVAPAFEQRWSIWTAVYGGSQRTDGNTVLGSNDTRSSIYGTAVGADYRFSPNTIAGFALGGGGTNFSVNGSGWGRSDLFQAGAFVRHNFGPSYITAALAYGWQDVTTDRIVTIAGSDQLRARFNANAWSGRVEAGHRFLVQGFGLTPYAAGQFTTFDLPNYTEGVVTGNNTFALSYGAKSVTATRSEIGLRADKSFAVTGGIFTLRGRAAWAHDYNADRNVGATFQTLPGASFVVSGARQPSDLALTTASAEWNWINGWSAAATFEGEFSDISRSYAGKGVVRYAW